MSGIESTAGGGNGHAPVPTALFAADDIARRVEELASDIAENLGVEQSLVSHHLRLLRAGRVLKARRQGKQMFYSVADEHISCVVADMVEHVIEPVDEHDE